MTANRRRFTHAYLKKDPCVYCGRSYLQIARSERTREHVIPRKHGGTDDIDTNIVACCHDCNVRRMDHPLLHWLWAYHLIGEAEGAAKILRRNLRCETPSTSC